MPRRCFSPAGYAMTTRLSMCPRRFPCVPAELSPPLCQRERFPLAVHRLTA
jgi:hypothetical protein